MAGTVLVLTSRDDHTSDLIVVALRDRGAPVVRIDPGTGPIHIDARLTGGRWHGTVGDEHRTARLDDIVGVLWRWPTAPAGDPAIADPDARAWAAREDTLALYGVMRTLPAQWVNHPARAQEANQKPGQLLTARSCGLPVPDTLITSSGQAARSWGTGRDVLYKAFHAQGADPDQMVVAGRVHPGTLPPALGAACTFQQVIGGSSIRLTAVGDSLFAARITGGHDLDWRPDQDRLGLTPVHVPEPVAAGVRTYMRTYGLQYGAFDFIDSPAGWVFLECNPTGMYGFVEITTGLPISDAIATLLCRPSDTTRTRMAP